MADGMTLNGQAVVGLTSLLRGFGRLQTFTPVPQITEDGIGHAEETDREAAPRGIARRPTDGIVALARGGAAAEATTIAQSAPPHGIAALAQGTAGAALGTAGAASGGASAAGPIGGNLDLLA